MQALALAWALASAIFLLQGRPAAAASPADGGTCTLNLTENWTTPVRVTPALNDQFNFLPSTGACTAPFTSSLTIWTLAGAADEVSCSSLGDLEGTFLFQNSDGSYGSGNVLSLAGAGTLATQQWVFLPEYVDFFDAVGTFRLTNPTAELQQCESTGISSVQLTATIEFVDQSEVTIPIGLG